MIILPLEKFFFFQRFFLLPFNHINSKKLSFVKILYLFLQLCCVEDLYFQTAQSPDCLMMPLHSCVGHGQGARLLS